MNGLRLVLAIVIATPATARDLYPGGSWPALASDQVARAVGDLVTIIVAENSVASSSATNGSKRASRLGGRISAGSAFDEDAALSIANSSDTRGETKRSGQMAARLSGRVDAVLPNGDLMISAAQRIRVNGETNLIMLRGRARQPDLTRDNILLSSRLADAEIDFDGKGFVSRSARPGLVTRVFTWLGL